jgi:hypothetical protein
MDCALSMAKIIAADFNIANTTAWQWWTTFERGKHDGESRFSLIEAFTNNNNSDGEYHLNKLFYTFGNFSHFIRPGMTRIGTTRSDNLTANEEFKDVVFSAYTNNEENKLVLIAVNFTREAKEVVLLPENITGKAIKNPALYLTNEFSNLSKQDIDLSTGNIVVPARSVVTYTADLEIGTSSSAEIHKSNFNAYLNIQNNEIVASFSSDQLIQKVILYSISGTLIQIKEVKNDQNKVVFPVSQLSEGVYLVSGMGNKFKATKKVIITKR